MIVGRSAEQSPVNRLVADAKGGRSRSLVLRGEAGIGKTALLDYAQSVGGGMRVLRVVGIESEAEVAYAALHLMFVRDLHRMDALPGAQAEALGAAFGASNGPVERMLSGAATLSLLSDLADAAAVPTRRRPVVRPVIDRGPAVRGAPPARRPPRDHLRRPGR